MSKFVVIVFPSEEKIPEASMTGERVTHSPRLPRQRSSWDDIGRL